MKILIFGDIYGRNGRLLLKRYLGDLLKKHSPDFTVANVENLSSGKGPTVKHLEELRALGIDAFTGGDHVFTNLEEITPYLDAPDTRLVRPANFYESKYARFPGRGELVLEKNGKRILIVNLISGIFLRNQVYNPFLKADEILSAHEAKKESYDAIIVDFHRETTAELYCMAEFLSGRTTFVYGTHTHVQTNDEHILASGTGMITDVGMTGPLHSSIGQKFDARLQAFLSGVNFLGPKPEQDLGLGVVNAILVEIESRKCIALEKIRIVEEVA